MDGSVLNHLVDAGEHAWPHSEAERALSYLHVDDQIKCDRLLHRIVRRFTVEISATAARSRMRDPIATASLAALVSRTRNYDSAHTHNDAWSVCRSPNEIGEAMITWTHIQNVDGLESVGGKNVETHSSLSLGNFEWSVAWLAAIGSFGSFLVSLAQAVGLWH
jgi:hypothetical protein